MNYFFSTFMSIFFCFIFTVDNFIVADDKYKLGPGDYLQVSVLQDENLNFKNLKVEESGLITLGYAGKINLFNLSTMEAEQKITQHLEKSYLKKATVGVSIAQYGSKIVKVYGEVKKAGETPITKDNPLIPDLISLAGGKTNNASDMAYIVRDYGAKSPLAIIEEHKLGITTPKNEYKIFKIEQTKDFNLLPGDFLFIPPLFKITLAGEIATPGTYGFSHPPDLVKAIAEAKGFKNNANKSDIKIKRNTSKGIEYINVNYNDFIGDSNKTFSLLDGDVVIVSSTWF